MPRPPRPIVAGAIYHVTTQADGDDSLYLDAADRRIYLAFLGRAADHHALEIHAWTLMTNHSHLLLTTPAADVDRAMHRLNSRYAHWFNDVHGGVGHVFRRRYGAKLVETEAHLHWCYRYIAMNPVDARLCAKPEEWRWSSFGWLFGGFSPRHDPPSDERHLLRHWGSRRQSARPPAALRRRGCRLTWPIRTCQVPGTGHARDGHGFTARVRRQARRGLRTRARASRKRIAS